MELMQNNIITKNLKEISMNKGYIGKNSKGEIVILEEVNLNDKLISYDELALHPYHKGKKFELGSEINFQYAKECTIHFPDFCFCKNQQTFALIIPYKKKNSLLKKIKSLWK